jgi:hypothetical protein
LELDRPQNDRPAACVIAQQYSSAMFFSLRFRSRREKFDVRIKKVIFSNLLPSFKLYSYEIVVFMLFRAVHVLVINTVTNLRT